MEDLTKTQLILLALLVSFVTSMATGIVAVTLMDQASDPVVQTINRIVERTVETVRDAVPVSERGERAVGVMKETTVVVKEEDLITQTIEKNSGSLVRISAMVGSTSPDSLFTGVGVILSADGLIAADGSSIPRSASALRGSFADGSTYELLAFAGESARGAVLYRVGERVGVSAKESPSRSTFRPAVLADASSFKLGQTVIALGGESRTSVAMGIISALIRDEDDGSGAASDSLKRVGTSSDRKILSGVERIETTLAMSAVLPGSPVFNIFGELVALAVSSTDPDLREYVAAGVLAHLISAATPSVSLDR